jgi:hypothetical protein
MLTLQIVGFLSIYRFKYPVKLEMLQAELYKIFTLESLNAANLVSFCSRFRWFQGLDHWVSNRKTLVWYLELTTTVQVFLFSVVVMLILMALLVIPNNKLEEKIYGMIQAYKGKMVFNGPILSCMLMYLQSCEKFKGLFALEDKSPQLFQMTSLGVLVFAFPWYCFIQLYLLDSEDMLQNSTKQKFEESLFKNIAVTSKHDSNKKYFVVFQLARLFVYSFVPAVCSADLGVQSCCLLALQIVYCAAYLHTKPHFRSVFRRQVINELLLLVVLQNSLFFTDYLPPGQTKINLAQLDIIVKLFLVGLNFSWILADFVQFKIVQSKLSKVRRVKQSSKSQD